MKGNSTISKSSLSETPQVKVKSSLVSQLINYSKSLRIEKAKQMKQIEYVLN